MGDKEFSALVKKVVCEYANAHLDATDVIQISEDDVYNVVSTIFENAASIAEAHDKGSELDLEFATSITNVPYHPGAAKYFAEKGIEVPAK